MQRTSTKEAMSIQLHEEWIRSMRSGERPQQEGCHAPMGPHGGPMGPHGAPWAPGPHGALGPLPPLSPLPPPGALGPWTAIIPSDDCKSPLTLTITRNIAQMTAKALALYGCRRTVGTGPEKGP